MSQLETSGVTPREARNHAENGGGGAVAPSDDHANEVAGRDGAMGPSVPRAPAGVRAAFAKLPARAREWLADPDFSIFFVVFMLGAIALYLRPPSGVGGGFVFDEQEAILANPYVRGGHPWLEAFRRDFWGLLPDRSIGSYRPIPNLLWRGLWRLQEWRSKSAGGAPINTPFVWFNIVFHATNAALLASMVRGVTRRVGVAWLAGAIFAASAILTEAVSGIVGIADVLGGLSLLLAFLALTTAPLLVGPAVFAATLFGLLSKESAIVNVGLVPLAALLLADEIAPGRAARAVRVVASFVGTIAAVAVYFVIRHKSFHVVLAVDPGVASHGVVGAIRRIVAQVQHYVGAPNLPVDPFNNPLAEPGARPTLRVAGALRVYARGLVQVLAPHDLSPDYSTPQEPLPARLLSGWSLAGALLLVGPPLLGVAIALRAWGARGRPWLARPGAGATLGDRRLLAYALIAWPAAFFPLSNIVKSLPTVRAERFWYTPALATSIVIAFVFAFVAHRGARAWAGTAVAVAAFLIGQSVVARAHASHFRDDLTFWESASRAVPNSAKAHLNYSVMLGARGVDLRHMTYTQAQEARLVENIRATELATRWDMAFIYVGDTLCQLNRTGEAWDWYVKGFRIGPQNSGLIALALQCLSDKNDLLPHETQATALVNEPQFAGSWLAYLVRDTLDRERKCRGTPGVLPPEPSEGGAAAGEPSHEPGESGGSGDEGDVADSASAGAGASVGVPSPASSTPSGSAAAALASTSAPAGAGEPGSASAQGTGDAGAPSAPAEKSTRPPCGVDPKYRPRGLDGDPKGE